MPVPPEIAAAERELTEAHAEAVAHLLAQARARALAISTYRLSRPDHPAPRRTSAGPGRSATARCWRALTGIAVVNDFRSADVAAGGQGAPFVPLYHACSRASRSGRSSVVNIGGVANVTYVGADDEIIAFDTGPGNAAIDDWVHAHTGKRCRRRRHARARRAASMRRVLAAMLDHPIFDAPPPKSLDRFDFPMAAVEGLSAADGAATLTAFTAASIARAREHFPERPRDAGSSAAAAGTIRC